MGFLETVIRRKVMTTVILVTAVIIGALSYARMDLRRFPDVAFPIATITTIYPGGGPEGVETEITRRIEDAVSSITGIDEIKSFSQQGMSLIIVRFDLEEDIDIKAMDIRDKLDQIRALLPADAEDPIVAKFDFGQMPVITLALTGPQDINELYRVADELIEDRLAQVHGVADVQITGGQRREIHVLLDPVKLRKHSVSVDEIDLAIRSTNLEVPAGHISEPSLEYSLRTTGRFKDVDEILRVPIRDTGGAVLEIRHLGEVKDTLEERRSYSRADGRSSIIISISKQSGSNDVQVSDGVQKVLPELKNLIPEDADLFIMEDTSDFVRGSLANVRTNMIIGILLTSVALYLFLGSWRGTVIVAVVMPSALLITFGFMAFSGITINILTLTALALAMGIVVNNSILVLENSQRFVDEGLAPVEAAIAGTKDIGLAIISATATNLVVFLPIAFMGEIIGMFFKEFGLTIVYVTIASLFVSFTLTPMMCALLLRRESSGEGVDTVAVRMWNFLPRIWNSAFIRVRDSYLELLEWCLQRRGLTIFITLLAMAGCLVLLITVVGAEFFPRSDEGRFNVAIETPVGSSLELTLERVEEVESIVRKYLPEGYLEHSYSRVGSVAGLLGGSSSGTNLARVSAVVIDKAERGESVQDLINMLSPYLADVHSAKLTISAGGEGGGGGAPIAIEISGYNIDQLRRVAGEVVEIVAATEGTSGVDQSYRTGQPEIRIIPDQEKLGRRSLTVRGLAMTLRTYVDGRKVSQFRDGGEDYDIRLILDEKNRQWTENVRDMFIKSPVTGEMIPIREVAEFSYDSGPTVITRKDRRRLITVNARLTGGRSLNKVVQDIRDRIDREVLLPEGVTVYYGGETERMVKNFTELFKAMATAAVLTFLCVAGIIESFLVGTIILLAVPVSIIGVTLALLIANVALNIFSLMAMIMLVGMVVNNAIIVLDYATRAEHKHLPVIERIRNACRLRFRVIVMANLTTIVAMIPLSLGLGFAGEIFRPLAVVQMGGVFSAATLTMIVIPVIYTAIETRRSRKNPPTEQRVPGES